MPLRKGASSIRRMIEEALRDLLESGLDATRLRNQLPGNVLPPATPETRGGVTLSDDDPLALGTADPGVNSSVSRSDHVHPSSGISPPYVVALDGTIVLDETGEPVTAGG